MAYTPKQAIERAITLVFFMLLVIDVIKVITQPPPAPLPKTQQNSTLVNNTAANQTLNESDVINSNNTVSENVTNKETGKNPDDEFEKFKKQQQAEAHNQEGQQKQGDQTASEQQEQEKPKQRKIYSSFTNPAVVQITYCYSLLNNFQTFQQQIQNTFPSVEVIGSEYQIPQQEFMISKAFQAIQYGGIAFSLFGDKILAYLKIAPPAWYSKIQANKWTACFAIFLGGNFVNNYLTQTGAFEIYINEKLIFSKLSSRHLPGVDEVLNSIEKHLGDIATSQQM